MLRRLIPAACALVASGAVLAAEVPEKMATWERLTVST
jgi:hypothetical protein